MSFEVTSETVVKILIRRGLEADRINTLLNEGELGYSVDNRRLFIGDGTTLGGVVVGNKHFGKTSNKAAYTPYAQQGDLIFSNNENWFYDGNNWLQLDPEFYNEPTTGPSLEKTANDNLIRVSPNLAGQGFALDYSEDPNGTLYNTIQQTYGKVNFDARYLSLCASQTSFYFGNIFNKTVKNNLDATVNISKNLFVNDTNSNPYQLQVYAQNPVFTGRTTMESISGGFTIKGKTNLGLLQGGTFSSQPQILISNNGQIQFTANNSSQSYTNPGNIIYGVTRIYDDTFVDDNLTVAGSLSVLGNISYLDTIVSITSALSVINVGTGPAITVKQTGSQPIAQFFDDSTPALTIIDGGNVGINDGTPTYKLDVNGTGRFTGAVQMDNNLGVSGSLTVTGALNANGGLAVTGAITSTGDITAFFTSDGRLKDNKVKISSAIEKLKQISGISFDWNEKSGKTGKDYGVIAQEVEAIMPEIVTTRDNGYKAVYYEKLIPLLIEAIKELAEKDA